ncbi:MAG: TetR/AcrR family transcriptional regulator [Lachnospiraceae bacterium]|nr:TetR/AcrR family transcriptional regulator [Lachnospiraceae bacterium]
MKNTRKLITETAIELFKEKGYKNTSVTDICKACGITKGTFYYHFPNKDEITFEFYENIYSDFSDILVDVFMMENAKEQLWKIFEFSIDHTITLTPKVLYALLMSDIQKGFDLFTPYGDYTRNTNSGKMLKLMIELVKKGQQSGQIKDGDSEMMVRTYIAALMGIAIAWSRSDGIFDEKEDLKKAFDIIF